MRNYDAAGANLLAADVFTKTLNNTSWRIGGVYQPRPNLSFYAQYVTGVDPLGTITSYSAAQVQYENATGRQVEAGAKWSFMDGRGEATLAAYRIVKNNLLSQQTPTSPVEQVGERSSQGVEASVSFELPMGFGIDANGTVLNSKFEDFRSGAIDYAGKTPPNAPETAGNLWLRWGGAKLELRGGLRYVGRMYSDNANRFRIPAYTVVDATATYFISPNVAVDLRLYNLTDKVYAVNTWADEQFLLGRPRSAEVGLKVRF
jgi:iron complex outermembrane receptor protein